MRGEFPASGSPLGLPFATSNNRTTSKRCLIGSIFIFLLVKNPKLLFLVIPCLLTRDIHAVRWGGSFPIQSVPPWASRAISSSGDIPGQKDLVVRGPDGRGSHCASGQ